ncbi:MAG: replication-associated recombination protein A [SAR202 cluster bacterium]|jgi:putative ATPase|nr:MAG: replication-associated recombination protein A [SAR202 cluster bacterium]MCH2318756.1 replication-associated recombination protein A [SAR202 cluster bacterium]|tara:strand:- start:804 stop:2075 length:1272 start_codon:yes stop_codon:yes gene_type:complete
MRPRDFSDFIGQEHVIGENTPLRQSLEVGGIPSFILWGPPGTGKTSLANIVAKSSGYHFQMLSAVTVGVSELRASIKQARERLGMESQRTILFIDEIHRFNKSQQDVILPHVEDGTVVLIGATTENPSFEVISPLLSRCRVYTLTELNESNILRILKRAISDRERGLGIHESVIDDSALMLISKVSSGDARWALNTLELAVDSLSGQKISEKITRDTVKKIVQDKSLRYDKGGDNHYDTISAFIKSIRASDPDSSVYWLARMLRAGEDPNFIARRLVISASEDIGLADPRALTVAVAAQQAVHFIGMPEGRIPLSQATLYLACAPKSNSAYKAINEAMREVSNSGDRQVPLHLRNAVTKLMEESGYGENYIYPHDYEGHFKISNNLPEELSDSRFYEPSDLGYEKFISDRLQEWWQGKYNQRR